MQLDAAALLQPISADRPCGDDLEDTQLLASFDAYRVFGQATPLTDGVDWREIRDRSLEALGTSKDLRLLTHLASAAVRTDGLDTFAEVVSVGSKWLGTWWSDVYPKVEDDFILRRNALNGLADRMAIVDGLRRAPVLAHRQLGSFSIRDIEIATGQIPPPEGEAQPPDAARLNAVLTGTEVSELRATAARLDAVLQSLKDIESSMREQGGIEAAPDFTPVSTPVARTLRLLNEHIATRAAEESPGAQGNGAAADGPTVAVGSIRSREDAMRALDAVALFFRRNEPSSPIPLFIERAKRLVAKDFLEVLADVAPDALSQAKAAGGVRDE
ncbi:MAG TPA: type VI secretion system protein TssA [Steroidobacteraceae bacterium]|nr:type VI secretion system protein TssA [Steroidobacteraceae bacterium]